MDYQSPRLEVESRPGLPLNVGKTKDIARVDRVKISPNTLSDACFYPSELALDLQDCGLSQAVIKEVLACAWEYVRCLIPHYTNWSRYITFCRVISIACVAEYNGHMVKATKDGLLLGHRLEDLLDIIFAGTPGHAEMVREFQTFMLVTTTKTSDERNSELFCRYIEILAKNPKDWFRLRDCDALLRFTIMAALRCNDLDDVWFQEDEFQILTELGDALYDSVAFYKHRAEGEASNTYAYAGESVRTESFRQYRQVLWALDVSWAQSPAHRCVVNLLRNFGGPIHMTMRRYRFVEDDLMLGLPETERIISEAKKNVKLWYRQEATEGHRYDKLDTSYTTTLANAEAYISGFTSILQLAGVERCTSCCYDYAYGASSRGEFSGVQLCNSCRTEWQSYMTCFPQRVTFVFPCLKGALQS